MKRLRDAWEEIVAGIEEYREGITAGKSDKWERGWARADHAMREEFAPLVKQIELAKPDADMGHYQKLLEDLRDFAEKWPTDGRQFDDGWENEKDYTGQAVAGICDAHKARLLK